MSNSLIHYGPYRIRIKATYPLLLQHFYLFEKRRSPQLGPQSFFAENISGFESGNCNDELPYCQHPRKMLSNDVIQFINQFWSPESDMHSAFLKVFDCKHLILVTIAVPVFTDMIT